MEILNCESVDTDSLITSTYDLIDVAKKLFINGAINNQYSTIEQISNARTLIRSSKALVLKFKEVSTKSLICKIISTYDLEPALVKAEEELKQYLGIYEELDTALEADISLDAIIESDNPNEAINQKVNEIFSIFTAKFQKELEDVKQVIKQAFYLLEYIGSTREEIDAAIEEVEYQDNIQSYLTNLFINLADKAVNRST